MTLAKDVGEPQSSIYCLPNELLVHLLTPFTTRELLPLTVVSQRFHNIILRILHYRLLLAASLQEYKLILECYHPSSKYTEPYLFCTYLGTDGLSSKHEGEGSLYEDCANTARLGKLGSLYSRFRPERPDPETKPSRPYPAGGVGSQANSISSSSSQANERGPSAISYVTHNINLDSHELFSQLCTITNLVKVGPRRGVFLSVVNVGDGVLRIWRDWLAKQRDQTDERSEPEADEAEEKRKDEAQDTRMLWTDSNRNVGLRVRVRQRKWRRETPLLMHQDDDSPVSYSIDLEELVIRTTHLLLAVETSLEEQRNHGGKAMIFGSFKMRAPT